MNVWLIVPAHGRARVSAVAFAGLRWTLDTLSDRDIDAHVVVVAEDENLELAEAHGFDTIWRENRPLGRKWNDGYEHACYAGATHVMPCGSDDWVHPDLLCAMLETQEGDSIACTHHSSIVSPDGSEISTLEIVYVSNNGGGGDGIRLLPAPLLKPFGYRPTIDKKDRAIDGATFDRLSRNGKAPIEWAYVESHPLQIIDFKSATNLTPYEKFADSGFVTGKLPFAALAEFYPPDLIDAAEALYA